MDAPTARSRLETMLADLERSIATLTEAGGSDRHPADSAAHLSDSDRIEAAVEVLNRQRAAIVAALRRIDTGRYGECVDCDAAVPEGRLEARPEAARCVPCQAKHDRNHR